MVTRFGEVGLVAIERKRECGFRRTKRLRNSCDTHVAAPVEPQIKLKRRFERLLLSCSDLSFAR